MTRVATHVLAEWLARSPTIHSRSAGQACIASDVQNRLTLATKPPSSGNVLAQALSAKMLPTFSSTPCDSQKSFSGPGSLSSLLLSPTSLTLVSAKRSRKRSKKQKEGRLERLGTPGPGLEPLVDRREAVEALLVVPLPFRS